TPPMDAEDRGQYTAKPAKQVRSELAHALLNGEFSGLKMQIEEKGPSRFVIVPKRGTSGTVQRAEIQVNPTSKLIEYVKLFHSGGNTAEIKLSDQHRHSFA
ncbi:MAG: outer-membrane lipoprotein carrier protein LolA, partial [Planctomycetota bacterium]